VADLCKILGGPWSPPSERYVAPPESQLIDAIRASGMEPPEHIHMDGKIHRFKSGTKGQGRGGDKPGWYVVYGDGVPAGRFGCWRSGLESSWRADVGRQLTPAEEMAHTRRMEEAKRVRDIELKRQHEAAAETVEAIWSGCMAASAEHPYLARKGVQAHGARVTGDGRLVVPMYGDDGTLSSLQYISHDGSKLYHPGGQTGGKFWMVGTMDEPGALYVAEGFATGATVHEVTSRPCVVAYSASSLPPVVGVMRERYGPSQEIVVVADNDKSGTGQKYADQAGAKFGATVIMPPIEGMDANDYMQAGHDLAALLGPQKRSEWLIAADDFSAQPAPISWLVKHWLQSNALIMVHGPSGGGKTFVVLDWCLRMASGMKDWFGNKVKPANVVYLAGEGHHGLRGRIAAWKHRHQAKNLTMWLSKDGCDLNTPEGYARVANAMRQADIKPGIVVVDTLHRFLAGDENSAQDAKTMLDACNNLMIEFDCAVLLVHHTGVSDEAQHRARGSSAWRGALDVEISVIPAKGSAPMQIVQRKSKDAEMAADIFARLASVEIPGWFDEDGQQVTSAVVEAEQAPPQPEKRESDVQGDIKKFTNAWFHSGAESRNDCPYLSKSALINYLINSEGLAESTAQTYAQNSKKGRLIYNLLNAEIIVSHEHGWVVQEPVTASVMMLRRSER
jgi:putative DNA primase/helicase